MYSRLLLALLAAGTCAELSAAAEDSAPASPPINGIVREGFMTAAPRATNCTAPEKAVELARLRVERGAIAAYDRMQLYTTQHVCAVSDFAALQVGKLMYQGRVDGKDIVVVKAANYNGLYVMLVASYEQKST